MIVMQSSCPPAARRVWSWLNEKQLNPPKSDFTIISGVMLAKS